MNNKNRHLHAFTLIELLVVITIIAVLAGLTMAVSNRVLVYARGTKCLGNVRELTRAALLFAGDNNMSLPVTSHQRRQGGKSWSITLQEYAGGKIVFRCPTDENATRQYTYLINDFLTPSPAGAPTYNYSSLSLLASPANTVLFTEASKDYTNADHFHFSDYAGQAMPPEVFADMVGVERHGGKANYAFADGHVEMLKFADVKERLSAPGSKFVDPAAEP
jgi:prepilin-type processing-associated H-X9-DG protein/prepilin-type N-terminal cleavage/methylation domain-containing protein